MTRTAIARLAAALGLATLVRRVTLPPLLPALISGWALSFFQSLTT